MTPAQAVALLPVFNGAKGLVPATGGSTGRFLKDDGTWAAVSAGGATEMVRSVETLKTLTSTSLPGVDGQTIIYVGSYWNGNKRGGGFFRLNSAADTTAWRIDFMTILDASGRKWERIIEPQGIDFYMTGAKGDATIDNATGAVSGTNDVVNLNKIADYIISTATGKPPSICAS